MKAYRAEALLQSQGDLFKIGCNCTVPAQFAFNGCFQCRSRGCFPMAEEGLTRCGLEISHPRKQFSGIGMGRKRVYVDDLRPHRNVFTMDSDLLCAANHGCTACSRRLKSGKENHVARIWRKGLEMMHDPASRGHAAGRYDDPGTAGFVQCD